MEELKYKRNQTQREIFPSEKKKKKCETQLFFPAKKYNCVKYCVIYFARCRTLFQIKTRA